jgi:ADP-heptose:LPS heptosyltransferase
MIRQQYPEAVVVVLGGRGDAAVAKRIADGVGGISLAGDLSLRNSVAVIGQSTLLVTNDTGLLHAGVAVDTPTLALFAATGIENIDPYREFDRFRTVSKPKTCTPCVGKKCEAGTCMEQILPEDVLAATRELLSVPGCRKELVY